MFRNMGALEIGLIVIVILIVFGAGKLPQIGGAIGKAIREFRAAVKDESTTGGKITAAKSSDGKE